MSIARKIKAGVIGVGKGGLLHIEALRRLGFVDVVAIATSSEKTAQHKAKILSIPKAYGDYRELIDDKDVEVVHIATPNYLHFPQAKYALEAGKHVICDKPLGMNSTETAELVEFAKGKRVVNAVTFNLRFFPMIQQARTIVRKNVLGPLLIIRGWYLNDWLLSQTDYDWRFDPEKGGSTQVTSSVGSHWLDLIQFVSGLQVDSVFADFGRTFSTRKKSSHTNSALNMFCSSQKEMYEEKEISLEDSATVLLRYSGRAKGIALFSDVSAGRKLDIFFEMSGLKGSLAWHSKNPEILWLGFREKPNEVFSKDRHVLDPEVLKYAEYPPGQLEGYSGTFKKNFRLIYDYIMHQKHLQAIEPDFPTFETGHKVQVIIDSIKASTEKGTWVKIRD